MIPNWSAHAEDIARRIFGEPNRAQSSRDQLRFGAHGSIAVELAGEKAGSWFDHENKIGGGLIDLIRIKGGVPGPEVEAWIAREIGHSINGAAINSAAKMRGAGVRRRIAKTYDYKEDGRLVYQVVRFEPKAFRQRRPGPAGRWIFDLKDVRRILYRLDELRAAPAELRVYIVEGEKDVDRLVHLGLVATCNSEGAGKWRAHFAAEFKNRDVVIVPDRDATGQKHALMVADNLAATASSVRLLELPDLAPKGDVSDWLAAWGSRERLEMLAAEAPLYRPAAPDSQPSAGNGGGLQLVGFDEMRPRLKDAYLVKKLLGSSALVVVFGAPGTGKTYWALHVSLHIAAGADCFGRRVRRCGVVYVAAEAGRGIENRIAAAKYEFKWPETMPFAAIVEPLNLCTGTEDTERLIATVLGFQLDGFKAEFIVVDTLSRTMGGGSEDQSADMGAFVANIDRLRAATGATIMIVHHSGKEAARGARGHSLLRGAVDTEIEVSRDADTGFCLAQVTKQREYPTEGKLYFSIRQVELGIDAEGDAVTACVIDEEDRPAGARSRKPKLSSAQQRALQLLQTAIDEAGEIPPASNHIPANTRCVTEELWRRYCYQGGISAGDQNAKRMAFTRAAEALVATACVGKWDPFVWLA